MVVDRETGEVVKVSYRDGTLNYDTNKVSDESGIACADPSLAQQHQKDEADINYMIERFGLQTVVERGSIPWPHILDVTDAGMEFGEALTLIKEANDAFARMPAKVRSRFDNDPQKFVDFCGRKENLDEARALGLAVPVGKTEGAGTSAGEAGSASSSGTSAQA